MKLKNIWKYIALVGFINLIGVLFYFIGMLIIYGGNDIVPLWASQWFAVTLLIILFSVFIAVIQNIKDIIGGIIEFLKE